MFERLLSRSAKLSQYFATPEKYTEELTKEIFKELHPTPTRVAKGIKGLVLGGVTAGLGVGARYALKYALAEDPSTGNEGEDFSHAVSQVWAFIGGVAAAIVATCSGSVSLGFLSALLCATVDAFAVKSLPDDLQKNIADFFNYHGKEQNLESMSIEDVILQCKEIKVEDEKVRALTSVV